MSAINAGKSSVNINGANTVWRLGEDTRKQERPDRERNA